MTTHNELLAEATQNYALAHHYLGKLKVALDQLSAVQSGIAQASRPPVRCVREWQDWLAANGPTVKGDIQEATGIKFTERGTPYTVEWTPALAQEADDRFAPNTLMKINTYPEGRGAPPKVYFLWSQRWDVLPKFGVGPTKPENLPASVDGAHLHQSDLTHDEAGGLEPVHEWLLESPVDNTWDEANTDPNRFATMDEWTEAWSPSLRVLAADGVKPSADVKQRMLTSLPVGQDGPTSIAMAYAAAARSSTPLLGVVMPPPLEEILEAGWSDEDMVTAEPEPEPDRSGWQMVGNHNHLPHAWSDFCAVSRCQRLDDPPA